MTDARPLRGATLYLTGLLFFACMDAATKYLASSYNVPLVVGIRYIGNLLLMILLLGPGTGRKLVETRRTGLVLTRAACLALTSLAVAFALQRMPVAETTAIGFMAPILVVLVARPLLGETIGFLGWTAALLGFAGVLLIARPGSGVDAAGLLFALLGVAGNVSYQLLSRLLVSTERTLAMLFYTALVGAIGYGLVLPWFWKGATPDLLQAALFLSLGVFAGLGHFCFTAAYRYVPASTLAPMTYVQLLWAALLGFLVFGHVPDRLSATGMCIIAAAGAAVALKSRFKPVQPTKVPA